MKKTTTFWLVAFLFTAFGVVYAVPASVTPTADQTVVPGAPSEAVLLAQIFGTPPPRMMSCPPPTGWCSCFTNEECQRWCASQNPSWGGYCNFAQGECGRCICTNC